MKIITSLLLVSCCLNAFGETNAPLASPRLFSFHSRQLRTPVAETDKPLQSPMADSGDELTLETPPPRSKATLLGLAAEPPSTDSPKPTTLNTEQALMLRYYDRLERGGYLTPPARPPDNLYARTVNAIFQPEVMRVGKTFVAFSPITAIKRKNPLALLNPIVLNIAW